MNLRLLKKLSKRAAPLVALLGDEREQYPAKKDGNDLGMGGFERKHLMRWSVPYPFENDCKYMPRHGKQWVVLRQPWHPWKGTIMLGAMEGYYEPEWSEQTAWGALVEHVYLAFSEYDPTTENLRCARRLDTAGRILAAAEELVANIAAEKRARIH